MMSAPKIMNSRCEIIAVDSGMPSQVGIWLSISGRITMKAAPRNEPRIDPSPPMITMNSSWNERFTSSIGYSMVDIDNSELQAPDAYKRGHYAVGNVLYTPVPGLMTGVELQWGRRENFSDGFSSDGVRVQFSAKYNFSKSW